MTGPNRPEPYKKGRIKKSQLIKGNFLFKCQNITDINFINSVVMSKTIPAMTGGFSKRYLKGQKIKKSDG
jgi:hypothetical protein